MKREFLDYIEDIIEAMNNAINFTQNIEYDDFLKDDKTIYAVVRALEIIGEAVKNLPDEIKQQYSQIPWRNIIGMRDKLIHEYFGIEIEIIWEVVKNELPPVKPHIKKLLKEIKNSYKVK